MANETKATNVPLTWEEREVLSDFATFKGRQWKSKLRRAWENGNTSGILQQLRNDPNFGPSGLIKFRL